MKGMKMNNCIFDDRTNDTIGYYTDLKNGLRGQAIEFIEGGDYEMASDICELLLELDKYSEFEGLLRLSENNGMGYTIRKETK